MSGNTIITIVACVLAALIAWRLDRSANNSAGATRRYRYGYFVALMGSVIFVASTYEVLSSLQSGTISVSGVLSAMLSVPIVVGVMRRRRFGWIALFLLVLLHGAFAAALTGISSPIVGVSIGVLIAGVMIPNVIYVVRRWDEMSKNTQAASDLNTLQYPAG